MVRSPDEARAARQARALRALAARLVLSGPSGVFTLLATLRLPSRSAGWRPLLSRIALVPPPFAWAADLAPLGAQGVASRLEQLARSHHLRATLLTCDVPLTRDVLVLRGDESDAARILGADAHWWTLHPVSTQHDVIRLMG